MAATDDVQALLFDVFGTVVDWRTSIGRDLAAYAESRGFAGRGIVRDWTRFADDWRALYQPAMEVVRAGRRPFTILDTLHRESLDTLIAKHRITGLTEDEIEHINRAWHRLEPWPDALAGLARLKTRCIIGPLSNGNVGLLVRLARHAKLPWDVVLSAETAHAYKPQPEAYLRSAEILNLAPHQVMLVAAHNSDLKAAAATGLRTAFVARPTEYGPHQSRDFKADGAWDIVTDSFTGLADKLGC